MWQYSKSSCLRSLIICHLAVMIISNSCAVNARYGTFARVVLPLSHKVSENYWRFCLLFLSNYNSHKLDRDWSKHADNLIMSDINLFFKIFLFYHFHCNIVQYSPYEKGPVIIGHFLKKKKKEKWRGKKISCKPQGFSLTQMFCQKQCVICVL